MIDTQSEHVLAEQFECLLASSHLPNQTPDDLRADFYLSAQLRELDLSAESRVRAKLRERLTHKIQRGQAYPNPVLRSPKSSRLWISTLTAVLLILVLVSNTPVRAALRRLIGFGYLPYAGFIPLSDTSILQEPVTQSGSNWTVTVLQGVQDPEKTVIWIDTNLDRSTLAAAELVLPDHTRLPIQSIQVSIETDTLIFPPAPGPFSQADLTLPGGRRFPLGWIAADQAGLAPTQVSTPFQTSAPCADIDAVLEICAQAAFIDSQGTHLLLQVYQSGKATSLSWNAAAPLQAISLVDENGRIYPVNKFEQSQGKDPSLLSLRFAAIPAEVDMVTLHLPAQTLVLAGSASIHSQTIEIPLVLPERAPPRSPTPGALRTAPDHPVAVPTPGANPQP